MFTQVKTPQDIFFSPQRLLVPLFQRPYVWSLDRQWQPLWDDVRRLAERIESGDTAHPHFLGAIVVQQQPSEIGGLTVRTVIDGQQRLTTLQIFFDAVFGVLSDRGLVTLAQQIENLVRNQDAYITDPSDRYKVWPTNRDRPAFNEVMSTPLPDYRKLTNRQSRLVEAHRFFLESVSEWLEPSSGPRANALVSAMSHHLQLVVIDLQPDEDAQEIFETLNARGTPLTAADLIKNFIFQRLEKDDSDLLRAYEQYWQPFETPFWEAEISVGRVLYSRSSLFLTQWLIAMTGEEITVREVFSRFKRFATESLGSIEELLPRLSRSAETYRAITEASTQKTGQLSDLELFVYRVGVLNTETFKPVLIWLTDPEQEPIPSDQMRKAIVALESWYLRRTLIRGTSKAYNHAMASLVRTLRENPRDKTGDVTEDFLRSQSSANLYWPGDVVVRDYLESTPIYRKLSRGKLRMVLEAVEDYRRGFTGGMTRSFSEQPVVRSGCTIEHIMPQDWRKNWPGDEYLPDGTSRNEVIHRLGNLVLVTQALNSKVSNGSWTDKRKALGHHSTLLTTKHVVDNYEETWSENDILRRTEEVVDDILAIWPVPAGHEGLPDSSSGRESSRVMVSDLVSAGILRPGQKVFARVQAHHGFEASIGDDGTIFVNGKRFDSPSPAAREVTKKQSEPGWWFWVTDLQTLYSLADAREEYLDSLGLVVDDDDDLDNQ